MRGGEVRRGEASGDADERVAQAWLTDGRLDETTAAGYDIFRANTGRKKRMSDGGGEGAGVFDLQLTLVSARAASIA